MSSLEPLFPSVWESPDLETAQQRLAAAREIADRLMMDSSSGRVWQLALILQQVSMGTITVAHAQAAMGSL